MNKLRDMFYTCVDFIIDKKRYFLAGLVCGVMVLLLAFGTDNSAASSNPLSGAYQAYNTEAADSEITNLIKTYYTAYCANDKDTLMTVCSPISDSQLSNIEFWSQYIDSYDVINVYTKRGADSNSYLVSVEEEIHFTGVASAAPGLDFFYVVKNDDGKLSINNVYSEYNRKNNEYEMDPTIVSLIAAFEQQDDLLALRADIQKKYNELQVSDAEFNTFTSETIPSAKQKWASDYKDAVAAAEEQAAKEAAEAEEAAKKAEEEAAAAAAAEEAAAQKEANAYQVKVTAKVNVRSSASTDGSSLGKVAAGTELKAYSEEGEWTLVSYNDQDAYIKTEFLERLDGAATTETTTTTEEETTTETATATNNTYSAGDKVLLYTTINIRESMSTTAKKVAVAYAGQKVEVVMQYEDGWTKVKYDGKEGYVKSEYLGPQ